MKLKQLIPVLLLAILLAVPLTYADDDDWWDWDDFTDAVEDAFDWDEAGEEIADSFEWNPIGNSIAEAFYDFIMDNPFETGEDKKRGLELLLKFPRPFHIHIFSLLYFPNTAITKRALSNHLISEDQIEGKSEQKFNLMFMTLKYQKHKPDQFWISLYSLASKGFVPKAFIRWLSRRNFLKKYPKSAVLFADFANTCKLGVIAIKWLLEGKPVFSTIRQTARRGSSTII